MYIRLHRNSKRCTFYIVKILKCESFLIALRRNSKSGPSSCVKYIKVGLFYSLSVETLKSDIFYRVKSKKLLHPPPPPLFNFG